MKDFPIKDNYVIFPRMVFFVKGHLNWTNRAVCSHENCLIILHKDKSPFSLESKAGWPSGGDAVDGIPAADTRPPVAVNSLSNSKIQLFYHFKCWLAKVTADLIVLILLFIHITFEIGFFSYLSSFYWVKILLGSLSFLVTLSNLLCWYP